jgi:ATP synthase protein I
LLESSLRTPIKALQNKDFKVFSSVALIHRHHYNARPELRPARTDGFHNATHRRLADGRGVFSVGGKRRVVAKVLLAQLGVSLVLAVLFWGTGGHVSAYSALLGGLTCVIPNAWLALRLAVPRRDPGAGALVSAAYIGELGKLALTALMFGVVFALVRPLAAGALFTGFIAAQLVTFSGFLMRDKNVETDMKKAKESTTNGD